MLKKIIAVIVICVIIVIGLIYYFNDNSLSDVKERDKYGNSMLHQAAKKGNYQEFAKLVSLGLDVNEKNKSAEATPLHCAALSANPIESLLHLIALGGDINAKNRNGETPVFYLIGKNLQPADLDKLIALGADITIKDNSQNTLLHSAAYGNNVEIIKRLVELGLDINAVNSTTKSPLHNAKSAKVYDAMVSLGANPNYEDNLGFKPERPEK